MPAIVIVGAQWGDEGKGKIVDIFTEHADMVVRFGGGPNAGHTLVVGDDKLIVRLIPSGVLRPMTTCVLAQGMVIDPKSLVTELDELEHRGLRTAGRLVVSDRAHSILPYHVLVDGLREQGKGAIGTTKRGVGPCYEDKVARRGISLGALRDRTRLDALVGRALESWAPTIRELGGSVPTVSEILDAIEPARARIVGMLVNSQALIERAVRDNKCVVFEGAQGTLLDVDHGTYPFVTSSSPTAGGACVGSGVGPTRINEVVGLVKAYTTRVGGGPFPTELLDETGERIRKVGDEFGSVTGRPRRTGWIDLPGLRYAASVNGLDALAITKVDVLTGLSEIKACVAYDTPRGRTTDLPIDELDRAVPVYKTFRGWKKELGSARTMDDLPIEAREYLQFIQSEVGCPAVLVSVGSRREETIILRDPFSKRA
ncbi:MAG: adenylosuccinate synthase [Polyangiaceae bacterium]|nr:adenylosuccinate synthase [Polyangiaceae bacterium]